MCASISPSNDAHCIVRMACVGYDRIVSYFQQVEMDTIEAYHILMFGW